MKKLIYEHQFPEITRGSSKTSDSRYFTTLRLIALYFLHYTFIFSLLSGFVACMFWLIRNIHRKISLCDTIQSRNAKLPLILTLSTCFMWNSETLIICLHHNSRIYDQPCNKLYLDNVKCKFVAYNIRKYGILVWKIANNSLKERQNEMESGENVGKVWGNVLE